MLDSAPVTTVRYHLQVAKKIESGLEGEHAAALPKPVGPSASVLQVMRDVVAFYRADGRLPSARAKSPREATLVGGSTSGARKHRRGPSPPLSVTAWTSFPAGIKPPLRRPKMRPDGRSVFSR